MGVLYWQLNDIWQGPTWSSVEHDGRWKMLHYVVRRAFAPVVVSGYITDDDRLLVYATSDQTNPVSGMVTVDVRRFYDVSHITISATAEAVTDRPVLLTVSAV